jgi:nicotinamidase-related amidase
VWGNFFLTCTSRQRQGRPNNSYIADRRYAIDGFRNSGADFMPEFKKYIEDGQTIICSPHKLYGPQVNDLPFQLRKQRIDRTILAGMLADMCVESHLREFLELGFEVAVVRDAVAAPKIPEGDGYLSAQFN